jgi:hypothetical protein
MSPRVEESISKGSRHVTGVLLACNLASASLCSLLFGSLWCSARYGRWMWNLNASFHYHYNAELGNYLTFMIWGCALACGIFGALFLFLQVPTVSRNFLFISGILNVVAAPVSLYFVQRSLKGESWSEASLRWLPLEVMLAIICALFFLRRPRSTFAVPALVLLVLHTAIWCAAYGHVPLPPAWYVPLVTFVALLAWGLYACLRVSSGKTSPRSAT